MYKILTQYSLWFLLLCILAGLGYAYLLYQKKSPWDKKMNYFLATLRFLLVTLLAFLLLGPLIKYFINYTEKPTIVIALDNSQSIALTESPEKLKALKATILSLKEKLEDANIDASIQSLENSVNEDKIDALKFDFQTTNLSGVLKDIQSNYENRNLAGVVLLTDGIYNQGSTPGFIQYSFPIHTVGLGDTIPKIDLSLKSLIYNKLSYKNNKFPIVAEIKNKGFKGQSTQVILKQGASIIETKVVNFRSDNEINKIEFYASASEIGMKHFLVEIKPLKGEFTLQNNVGHAYVDIIESKEKILLIASSPHPDIKAIRSAIEKKENYEFSLYIPGINEFKEDKYDLVILHQQPDYPGSAKAIIDKLIKNNTSLLFIIGNQTNINQLNNSNKIVSILSRQGQKDLVTPSINESFDRFIVEPAEQSILNNYPPLIAAYGDYTLKENADILMYQKIGNTISARPLILASADRKQAVIAGEGL